MVMGETEAAVVVACLLQRSSTIQSAGGYLRELTRKAGEGEFSLGPVLMAQIKVLCVKFCKGGHGWLESCGLAELNFHVLFEIVHIEIAVGFEPVLVGLDG